jgi:hypothetical protein
VVAIAATGEPILSIGPISRSTKPRNREGIRYLELCTGSFISPMVVVVYRKKTPINANAAKLPKNLIPSLA